MVYEPGAIDAALAAAVGDDATLIAELRFAFLESAAAAMDAIEQADTPATWKQAANRMKGLAASFGAMELMTFAEEAARLDGPDEMILRKLKRTVLIL